MKKYFLFALFCLFFSINYSNGAPKVIIKLDDLMVQNGEFASKATFDYLIEKKIKFSSGAIAKYMDNTAYSTLAPYLNAVDSSGNKLFEIWHHGYDHVIPEFSNHDYLYQKQHFENANKLFNKLLNLQVTTFGAPGNQNDFVTTQVFTENVAYHVFFNCKVLPNIKTKNAIYLNNNIGIENGTGNVNFNFFHYQYNIHKKDFTDYFIIQGHPNLWNSGNLNQFKLIIDFLIEQGCEFILPYDYFIDVVGVNRPEDLSAEKLEQNVIQLKWVDTNNYMKIKYIVDGSSDSITWIPKGTVENHYNYVNMNDTIRGLSFFDTDVDSKKGVYYYRVRPLINKRVRSNIVKVNVDTALDIIKDKIFFNIYPNPSSHTTTLQYNVAKNDGITSATIYTLSGKKIKFLFYEHQPIGIYTISVNVSDLQSGLYLVCLTTPSGTQTQKLIIK